MFGAGAEGETASQWVVKIYHRQVFSLDSFDLHLLETELKRAVKPQTAAISGSKRFQMCSEHLLI